MEQIYFNDTNMYTKYGLVLSSKEIGTPPVKTKTLEIPARDGVLDLTERLYGSAKYGNRTITLRFTAVKGYTSSETWQSLLSRVSEELHGKKKNLKFGSDPEWYYTGRCTVESIEIENKKSVIEISVDADPYKYFHTDSTIKTL